MTLLYYLRMYGIGRNSRKESVMVAAIIYQKSGPSLQRTVVQPLTQLLALFGTQLGIKICSHCAQRTVFLGF